MTEKTLLINATGDLWWKNAVFYCLDVETFQDSNGDGCGDFAGLIERLDYLAGIGINCLWLMPFYPSPNHDDGYDVSDYYAVDPRLGTLGEFVEFLRRARERGLRVIIDLVVNHTSDQHPWFQAARYDRQSRYRDYYVWRDAIPEDGPTDLVFPDAEQSNWAWDDAAGQYYLHRFYRHQPDLNIANPAVRDEIARIMGFWLQLGVAGFRLDAVPFLLEADGIHEGIDFPPHELLRELRAFLSRRQGDAVLIGEVNLLPAEQRRYFGDEDGDELHMVFNFTLNQQLHLALARQSAEPLHAALRQQPLLPASNQWANFVTNHDELTLDKLSEAERNEVFAAFAPKAGMRLFGRGIRRRLPPMLDNDQRRLRLVYSLLFALPGAPVLFYGEEIGLAENLAIPGRLSVRVPMQWTDGHNGGFSTAPTRHLRRPLVKTAPYAPASVNVAAQRGDSDSLLNWMQRLVRLRRECPEIGWGRYQLLDISIPGLLAHRCDWQDKTLFTFHNLAATDCRFKLALATGEDNKRLVELLSDQPYPRRAGRALELDGYGYRWFRLEQD